MAQPVIEGGTGTRSFSADEGARLTSPSIRVREPLMSEILTRVHRAKNKEDMIKILREENCEALQQILQWAYNPTLSSALPPGKPPYIENDAPEGTEHMLLRTEAKNLWHFVKILVSEEKDEKGKIQKTWRPADPKLQKTVMERMFIRLLEGLHKNEANLLCDIKDKKVIYNQKEKTGIKGLSIPILKEAFNWDDDFKKKDV
ncbi:MAG: DUF6433 family protein [Candidatus Thermoplasmatota archaeon]|nr:DUF6433 family protein [Candidatus Thermoplasmatota archaeon]